MRTAVRLAAVIAILTLAPPRGTGCLAAQQSMEVPEPIITTAAVLIEGVTVIDVLAGEPRHDMAVLVVDDRIAAVGRAGTLEAPAAAIRLDWRGRYLVPGFWDMHVHVQDKRAAQISFPLFLANGVTGVRELDSGCRNPEEANERLCLPDLRRYQRDVEADRILGPRLLALSGFIVNGPQERDEKQPAYFTPGTAGEARQLVRHMVDEGVDFIKVYSGLPRDALWTILEEAERYGLPVVGHKPLAVSAAEASERGMKSFEHARVMLFECYPGAAAFRASDEERHASTATRRSMVDNHDPAMCEELFETMVRNETYFVPTHLTRKMDAFADDSAYLNDPRLRYLPPSQREAWWEDAGGMVAQDSTPEGRKAFMDFYEKGLEITGRAQDAGVQLLTGTDANDSFAFPGFGLHDELAELAKAGLKPAEILRAATLNGAEFLGRSDEFGTVEAGKKADLVLLAADPLEDISNTRRIEAVVFDGNLYRRPDLDRLLDFVERQAAGSAADRDR